MTAYGDKGKLGAEIAKTIFPDLILVPVGGDADRHGIDAWLYDMPVQIKRDETIDKSGNLYHEIYEKDANCPEQKWRPSPHNVHIFIFVSKTQVFKITIDDLAQAEQGLPLVPIKPTSMGFLVPIRGLPCERVRIPDNDCPLAFFCQTQNEGCV